MWIGTGKKLPIKLGRISLTPEKPIFTPGDTIDGELLILTSSDIHCSGLEVKLEATADVNFEKKVDNITTDYRKIDDLLQDDLSSTFIFGGRDRVLRTEIRHEAANLFLGNEYEEHMYCTLYPGMHETPFSVKLRKKPLPGSFNGPHGKLTFRLVAYFHFPYHRPQIKVAEKIIKVIGHLDLTSLEPSVSSPIELDRALHKSLFSKRPTLRFKLVLHQTGFLPGEDLPFLLRIDNPKGDEIDQIIASLIHRVQYTGNGASKVVGEILRSREINDIDGTLRATEFLERIRIPRMLIPSVKGSIEHQYVLKVEINTRGKSSPVLKGEVPIIIGTVRGSNEEESESTTEPEARPDAPDRNFLCLPQISMRPRALSDPPANRRTSNPPSYSQLPTRAPSLETLPPPYDEAVGF